MVKVRVCSPERFPAPSTATTPRYSVESAAVLLTVRVSRTALQLYLPVASDQPVKEGSGSTGAVVEKR